MLASYQWLCELAGFSPDPADLRDRFTFAGLEVAGVTHRFKEFDNIVIGEIRETAPHDHRNQLRIVQVDDGNTLIPVVCGAPNCPGPGHQVALARTGAQVGDMLVAQRELAGVRSLGMLCSEAELQIGPDDTGIIILNTPWKPGTPVVEALNLEDWIFEIEVTPNRPDALYHLGLAREMCLLFEQPFSPPAPPVVPGNGESAADAVTLELRSPELSPRYAGAILRDLTVGPSPFEVRYRLHNLDIRPISNVVDITNLILMGYGQPLHAFDLDRLRGSRIVVRRARNGEQMKTLDGVQRTFTTEDLLICDGEGPVAVAGIMGGQESEVTSQTTAVLIECACFAPSSIRKTAKRLRLSSESSYRFERGVDPNHAETVLDATLSMIQSVAGGKRLSGILDQYPNPVSPIRVPFRINRFAQTMGYEVCAEDAKRILGGLGAAIVTAADGFIVDIPTFRPDMTREIDLVEEVARVSGLDRIEPVLPKIQCRLSNRTEFENARKTKTLLCGMGLQESVTYSFVPNELLRILFRDQDTVRIANPLNAERATMRTTLLSGLLENLKRATSRYIRTFSQFEVGRTYHATPRESLPDETLRVAILLNGERPGWIGERGQFDFYDIKGITQQLCENLTGFTPTFIPDVIDFMHPGRGCQIEVNRTPIGVMGEIQPRCLSDLKLSPGAVCMEMNLNALGSMRQKTIAPPLSNYPPMTRDVAFSVLRTMDAERIANALSRACEPLAAEIRLFDVYTGDHIVESHKSLAFSVQYRSIDRTLTEEEVDHFHRDAVSTVCRECEATLR